MLHQNDLPVRVGGSGMRAGLIALALGLLLAGTGPVESAPAATRYVFAKSGLRMRAKPSLSAKRLTTIPFGARVRVLKSGPSAFVGGRRAHWMRVRYARRTGWVFGAFLSQLNPRSLPQPVIHIDTPASGWTAEKVITVSGRIENAPGLTEARFFLNGQERGIPVREGAFSQKVVLGAGANYVKVEATNLTGRTGSAGLKLITKNSRMDLKVILTWDTDRTDVDLWVSDPSGERVYYAHRVSKLGGTLDIDITSGYGPETFTLPTAVPGEYVVQAQYFGGNRPTMARVIVVLYEGTAKEKRMTFPALLESRGKGTTIGRFTVE